MTNKLQTAIDFFKELHKDQKRRDGVRPYFVHLEDVARRVAQLTDDEDIIIAAFGHDGPEDIKGFTVQRVAELFGARAASFIDDLTDRFVKENFPQLNRRERKQRERERYATFQPESKLVKLADIASNTSDLDENDRGFAQMYLKEKAMCLPYLAPAPHSEVLITEINTLWDEASRILQAQKVKFGVR